MNATLIFTHMELKWEKQNQTFGIVEGNEGICWGQKVHNKSSKMGPPLFEFENVHAFFTFFKCEVKITERESCFFSNGRSSVFFILTIK